MDTAQIERTTDYGQFKRLKSNRAVYPSHVARLKTAFTEHPEAAQWRPILVNEKMEIIDGQHRFDAWKEIGLPVYFTVAPGLGVEDAQRMNTIQRNWSPLDYARSFAELGNKHYQLYVDAKAEFNYPHAVLATYLTQRQQGGGPEMRPFREGLFQVPDKERSWELMTQLRDLAPYWNKYKTEKFGQAMYQMMQRRDYDHERMVHKMSIFAQRFLAHQPSTTVENLRSIENIYNHKVSESEKIRTF